MAGKDGGLGGGGDDEGDKMFCNLKIIQIFGVYLPTLRGKENSLAVNMWSWTGPITGRY